MEVTACPRCGSTEFTKTTWGTSRCAYCGVELKEGSTRETTVHPRVCGIDACQEAASARCDQCGRVYCGHHAATFTRNGVVEYGARSFCTECKQKIDETEEARKEAARASHKDVLERLRAVPSRPERLVRALTAGFRYDKNATRRNGTGSRPYPTDTLLRMQEAMKRGASSHRIEEEYRHAMQRWHRLSCEESYVRELFPEYWPVGAKFDIADHPPWDDQEVIRWFVGAVRRPPQRVSRSRRTVLGGYKRIEVDAFWFPNGSVIRHPNKELNGEFLGIGVLPNGAVLHDEWITASKARSAVDRFNGWALVQMGRLAALDDMINSAPAT